MESEREKERKKEDHSVQLVLKQVNMLGFEPRYERGYK